MRLAERDELEKQLTYVLGEYVVGGAQERAYEAAKMVVHKIHTLGYKVIKRRIKYDDYQ